MFVLGLGMTLLTESGVERMGGEVASLTLAGIPVELDQAQTVPDALLAGPSGVPAGVLGGATLSAFDALIDVPTGRLVLKRAGRSVRWPDVSLSRPVPMAVFHGVLARVDVEVGEGVFGGLLDLSSPFMEVNQPLRTSLTGDRIGRFRMGYGTWEDLLVRVTDSSTFRGWDPEERGFVIIGAPVAYECAIAISWVHAEMRTCLP